MHESEIKNIVEAILITATEPVSEKSLLTIIGDGTAIKANEIKQALQSLQKEYNNRAFELLQVASGWQILTKEAYASWINDFRAHKPPKYSSATMETLAIIAYKQPVTRSDIESIRGVSVSSQIIKSLQEREWIRTNGCRDVPGKPALYVTTNQFLDYFKLSSIHDLPSIEGLMVDDEERELLTV